MKKLLLLPLIILACAPGEKELSVQEIIDQSIVSHGLDKMMNKEVSFTFRKKDYSMKRGHALYRYTRSFEDSTGTIQDVLVNSIEFTRFLNGQVVDVEEKMKTKYANSVNSVLYFVQLPYLLNDPAVLKKHMGTRQIKGKKYYEIEVRFNEESGGDDFDDAYLYWFETETLKMDYFAYSYHAEGGGVRFREAINRRATNDIVFQDYVNYEPGDKATKLGDLPGMFEQGKLKELSKIINENEKVVSL